MRTYIWLLRVLAITIIVIVALLVWGNVWDEPPTFGI